MRVDVQRLTRPGVLVASLAGLGVSIYLTFVHFTALQLVCTVGGAVNCERVLSSGYGVIAGSAVPTSAAGIAWFGVAAVLAAVRWRAPSMAGAGRPLAAWAWVGLLTVVYLVFIEIVELGAICIWCTVAHLMVLTVFILTVTVRTPDQT